MIQRTLDFNKIADKLNRFRVTALLGPRQAGKTTLARCFNANSHFDLENPRDMALLQNPQLALEKLKGLIVIDEIQRKPEIFPLLRYLVDTNPEQKYLILGSASPDLLRQSSESLAGRISYYVLEGIRQSDITTTDMPHLWLRGGLPLSFMAATDHDSFDWRQSYITTFLERDIPALGIRVPSETLRRFWQMISFYHGNILNMSEISRSFGIGDTTVRHYLDILQGTYMVRLLQPWYVNIGKRLVKRPKIYFRDSGIYHALLSIETEKGMLSSPKLGASWEGFALESVWRSIGKPDNNAYFWAAHAGGEVDLFWQHDGHNWACEFKYSDAPSLTHSIANAVKDLQLSKLWVIYPGNRRYSLSNKIEVLPLVELPAEWKYE